jgi:ABC-type bacteriocin/lantibiotic exporter with double-glycine peptidase domain
LSHERNPKSPWLPSEFCWLAKRIRPLLYLHLASFLSITTGSALGLLTPLVLKWLIDQLIPRQQAVLLLLAVGLIFLAYQGRSALTGFGNYLMLSAAQRMALTLRMSLLRHLDTLSADYYENTAVGAVTYPLKEPIDEISYFGSDLLPAILRSTLTTCFTIATMFVLSPALTLAVLPLVPIFLIVRHRFRQRLATDSDKVQVDRRAWSAFLEEHLCSLIPIQLLGQQDRQERRAFQRLARAVRSQQKLFRSGTWFTVGSSLAVGLSMCAVIGYGGLRVLAGALSVGSLIAFYSFVTQLFEPLSGAAELYARAQRTFSSVRQVQAAFAQQPKIQVASNPIFLLQQHPAGIDFSGVEFGYQRGKDMLHVPSLRIAPGERVAMVGENGSGKSTLAKLIVRMYEVDAGSISIGGEDIRGLDLKSLRRFVCYLPRDPILFDGTLAWNLYFVRPAASDQELQEVIHCAGLSAFVATLPDGLHQRIGPGACQLSGGQRQRLAIARALLQRPQILILDEATSCLDPSSEVLLLQDAQEKLSTSTLIVISHRLSILTTFERVVVLHGGRIVQDGNPDCPGTLSALTPSSLFSPRQSDSLTSENSCDRVGKCGPCTRDGNLCTSDGGTLGTKANTSNPSARQAGNVSRL